MRHTQPNESMQSRMSYFSAKAYCAVIAAAILIGAFALPNMAPAILQPAYAVSKTRIGSAITHLSNGATNLVDIEYTTTTTKSWTDYETLCVPNCLDFWTEVHFVKGVGSNDYHFQCGVNYNKNVGKWQIWIETLDPDSHPVSQVRSTANIPDGKAVTLKLGVPSYTGASKVQCTGIWDTGSAILGSSNSASYFKLLSEPPEGTTRYTGVMTEYADQGDPVNGSTVGTASYSSPKFVDTSLNQPTQTNANQVIYPSEGSQSVSHPMTIPIEFLAQAFKVSTNSTGKVTTT